MVFEAVGVKEESLHLKSFRRKLISSEFGRLRVKFVALVPQIAMFTPRPKTNPAKLVPAFWHTTRHMIAASIFLDHGVAFRTFLRIFRDPVTSVSVFGDFLQPNLHDFAIDWVVDVAAATKTEDKSASALNFPVRHQTGFDGLCAARRGTPFYQPMTEDEIFRDSPFISLLNGVTRHEPKNQVIFHENLAF